MPNPMWSWFTTTGIQAGSASEHAMASIRNVVRARDTVLLDTDRILLYDLKGGGLCAWVRRDVIDEGKEAE